MTTEEKINGENGKPDLSYLLDPKYPLLHKYRELCSGSYKHSQNLLNMVEAVALEVGLDTMCLKLSALYHDIGKMFNPKYFTENQLDGENPHDNIEPRISYEIITRHVSDSVMILINEGKFPLKVINIVAQHHGQSILKYFFIKSKTDNEDVYRYKTSKPTCIESAILMICDHIEAMSKSQMKTDSFDPKNIINQTINGLIEDEQLDDVIMRLGDLGKIKKSLSRELEGIYHKRINYDDLKDKSIENIS